MPRVGKKTAERLCIELGDKLKAWGGVEVGASDTTPASSDAVRALVALGYSDADAERAVRGAIEKGGDAGPAEVIKRALAALQGR